MSDLTWSIRDLHIGDRSTFVADFRRDGEVVATESFDLATPADSYIITDELGRYVTESGVAVIPQFINDAGEWQQRVEDESDPWRRTEPDRRITERITTACYAYTRRLEQS